MAIIKSLQTQYGTEATYWRIILINQHADSLSFVVDLAGYRDEAARRADKVPYKEARFNFTPYDHPLAELDPDTVNPALLEDWRNFDFHLTYVNIKAIAAIAKAKQDAIDALLPAEVTPEMQLTDNEQTALQFFGAEDRL